MKHCLGLNPGNYSLEHLFCCLRNCMKLITDFIALFIVTANTMKNVHPSMESLKGLTICICINLILVGISCFLE